MYKFLNINAKLVICVAFFSFFSEFGCAQRLQSTYLNYIEQYKEIAVRHQQEYGIPASITLAQGLLESRAGRSYLAQRGNNHFGIKCHSSWQGARVEFNDTSRHVCYRQYGNAEESFMDHAKFLKGKRYKSLYSLKVTDYKGWAQGLKDCGYAEDPAYPQKLVSLIEQYELFKLDSNQPQVAHHENLKPDESIGHSTVVVDGAKNAVLRSADGLHKIHRKWKLHYVKAREGDSYEAIAGEFDLSQEELLSFNDLQHSQALEPGMVVFLERKALRCVSKRTHKVRAGETLWILSQKYGIRLKSLAGMNHLHVDAELEPGMRLQLQ